MVGYPANTGIGMEFQDKTTLTSMKTKKSRLYRSTVDYFYEQNNSIRRDVSTSGWNIATSFS
ncbi:hypothetical protein PIL02S_00975 [Paenibacillus illinoisensis]|uniref:Uncharacterized protein n=1 Tax=Paenibacillus illinoisensis TaxID=59845 RepID=A0A2W0CQI9_9BACL|nr:hypothetical protein PIL02S_00975 [Paenibacillus illinoisensis]